METPMGALNAGLPAGWRKALASTLTAPGWAKVERGLAAARAREAVIYPEPEAIFRALALTPAEAVKVVILGQDPYHGPHQAMGLSFAVPRGERLPPSLRNIYKELKADLGVPPAVHGDLTAWAKQGVLLLNSILSVESGKPGSHAGLGWEECTDAIVRYLGHSKQPMVFILWGSHAAKKAGLIDEHTHLILKAPHPSPLSAHRGFFGSRPFSQANEFLVKHGRTPIDWRLPS
jgi:uracil-DNA glycosylase